MLFLHVTRRTRVTTKLKTEHNTTNTTKNDMTKQAIRILRRKMKLPAVIPVIAITKH